MGDTIRDRRKRPHRSWTRRQVGKLGLAAMGVLFSPAVIGGARAKVVVVGGGPAGTTAARRLASRFKGIEVSLVEANRQYVTPFFTNRHLAGLSPLESFAHGYEGVDRIPGIRVIHETAALVDAERKQVRLKGGGVLSYDRLIVAPGTDLIHGSIEGYTPDAESVLPHAYSGTTTDQWRILRSQLRAMEDGGVVVITVPPRPYRCHPAPYERASLIAHDLRRRKPRSKLIILDANGSFPLMDIMLEAWERDFGDSLEWVSADFGGAVVAVDPAKRSLTTVDDRITADVINVIPPQRAGRLAQQAGLADKSGWCPVNPRTFESRVIRGMYVLGDAIDPGDMPRSAFAAQSQAQVCAMAVGNALTGSSRQFPELSNACYFLLRERSALVVGGRYRPIGDRIAGVEGYASQTGEDDATRAATAKAAEAWYEDITRGMFG